MAEIEFEVKDHIMHIYLNRPEKLNAFTLDMISQFKSAIGKLRDDPNIWVGIISGRGRSFCTGIDLNYISLEQAAKIGEFYQSILIPKPIIAAIHGYCLAQGMGIALCSDIRIASEDAKFGWPQVKRGISSVSGPGLGSLFLPLGFIQEYLFTGEFMDAQTAYALHIVNKVVPLDKLIPTAEEYAYKICENAPLAVQGMKEALLKCKFTIDTNLDERLKQAGLVMERVLQTEDAKEGIKAFMEKRKPVWKAR